jgi:hypothetical protein
MAHHQPQHHAPSLGFTVHEAHFRRGDREAIVFDHRTLVGQLVMAQPYASSHGGDLPHTALLDAAARVYKEDPQLFTVLHQCRALLRLLRGDLAHDRETLPIPIAQRPPTATLSFTTPTHTQGPVLAGLSTTPSRQVSGDVQPPPIVGLTPTTPTHVVNTIQGRPDGLDAPLATQAVPEPSALAMVPMGLALVGLFVFNARKKAWRTRVAIA